VRDLRLSEKSIPEEREQIARLSGEDLAKMAPDLGHMRKAIEAGAYYSTSTFVDGFVAGLGGESIARWVTWLREGLAEDGVISRAYGITRFSEDDRALWRIRRRCEPWKVFEEHTGRFGPSLFVPALLLATSSRADWLQCLDAISVPEVLLWIMAAGDEKLERSSWLEELRGAPSFIKNNKPTGELRVFASIRLFVEHCEALESATSRRSPNQVQDVVQVEAVDLAEQLGTAIAAREDGELVLGHTIEYLANKVLFEQGRHFVPQVLLRSLAGEICRNGNPAQILKKIDGHRRKGARRWRGQKPKLPERVQSKQPEPESPHGEGASDPDENNGVPAWFALSVAGAAESRSPLDQKAEVWRLFAALLIKRDQGFDRIEHWEGARLQLVEAAGATLASTSDPPKAWMDAYVGTEPQRRRATHFHRYVDISVGMPTRVLIEVGLAATSVVQGSQARANLYEMVELAARRMWLMRPGGYRTDWEDIYAQVLAYGLVVDDGNSSKMLTLLRRGANSLHLVCATTEYCLRQGCSVSLLDELERQLGVNLNDILVDPIVAQSQKVQEYNALRQATDNRTKRRMRPSQ
jgi:hypothetical protein